MGKPGVIILVARQEQKQLIVSAVEIKLRQSTEKASMHPLNEGLRLTERRIQRRIWRTATYLFALPVPVSMPGRRPFNAG
jgi:hypothetical protein